MAKLSTYTKDLNITGKDMLAGSNYITTVNGIDQFETNNFTIKKLSEYFAGQISIDPGNLSLKTNGGIVYETVLGTDFLAIDLSATNITGQLANSDLANSYITINGSNIELGGSIDIPIGDITSVIAGTYLNGGGTINDVTINHDNTSRSDTTSAPSQLAYDGTFTAITSVSTNATGHLTAINTATYTLPSSDETNDYVDGISVSGTNSKTITLTRTGTLPDLTATFTDIDTTYTAGSGLTLAANEFSHTDTSSVSDLTATSRTYVDSLSFDTFGHVTGYSTSTETVVDNYVDSVAVTGTTTKTITLGRTGAFSDLTANFTDNDTIPNDATITLAAGTYISGGGDFTTDQSTNETITFNHDTTTRTDTTSSVGPNHGANFTVIDTLTSNATGHITDVNTKTVTLPNGANDNTITLSAGTYLSGGGDFTVDQSFDETLTINHDATSRSDTTSSDSNNAASDTFTAIDSVSTNATGHVTAVNLKTIQFPSDANTDVDVNVSNLETRLGQIGNTSIGSSGSTITIPNLTVTGTQTINNVEVISTSSGIVFEGTSNDANETTLNVINPTADRAINLPNKSGTVALTDDIETYDLSVSSSGTANSIDLDLVNSGGTDIVVVTGGGGVDVTLNSAQQFTISHTDTSSQSSVNNSGNTFIQDITVDTYGHITGITSGTATDNDTITQIREDNGSYRTGSITLQSGTNVTITEPSTNVFNFAATDTNTTYSAGSGLDLNGTVFSHTDTSSQSSVNNSGRTYIQDITLDTYGHVTGLTSATETVTDTNTTYDLAVPSGTTYVRLSGSDGTTDDVLITGSGSTTVTRVSSSALQISSTDTNTIPNNGTLTINTAGIASGSGTFTADQAGNSTITITATEADTLATVTARGNTTSASISVNQVIATNNGSGTNYRVGDDAWIGDVNLANTLSIRGVQDSTKGYITFGSSSNAQLGRSGTGALTWDSNTIWHAGNDGAGTGLDADLLDGLQPTDAATGSTVVSRNSGGDFSGRYIFATNFNQSAGIENPTIDSFWTSNSSDGYARKSNVAHVRSSILNDTLATVVSRGNTTSTTVDLRNATPLIFTSNGNTATYTQTAIYANQNNTSGSYTNGIFIERGKLSNSNSAEIRHLVIGSRGGQRQFVFTEDSLGIGVDAPDYILHTLGSGHERIKIESTGNSTAGVYMQVKSSGSQVGTGTVRVDNSGNMNFFVGSSNELERFRIYGPTGQVSVGISTVPSNIKFQSDGDIRINGTSGSLWIGGYNDSQAGRVRLHSANGAGYLDWEASSGTSSFIFRYDTSSRFEMSSGGTFTASADIVAYGSPSDITLKENIKPIENALDKVEKLQGVTFDWKKSDSILDIKEDIGFIAQDVQKVLPELVRENENGKLSLRHQGIVPILLEAIKELSDKIKALENGSTK